MWGFRGQPMSWSAQRVLPSVRASLSEALEGMHAVVTDNYATENALIALGMRESAIIRVPWGPENHRPDIPPKSASRVREQVGVGQDQTLLLYPRSLEPHYDPMVFVAALAEIVSSHPQVVAVLVESGSGVPEAKEAITHRGIDDFVRWVPLQSPDAFSSLLQAADAVVVTPKTDGTSVTVMEAMSQGIPVVCSLNPWVRGMDQRRNYRMVFCRGGFRRPGYGS